MILSFPTCFTCRTRRQGSKKGKKGKLALLLASQPASPAAQGGRGRAPPCVTRSVPRPPAPRRPSGGNHGPGSDTSTAHGRCPASGGAWRGGHGRGRGS